MKDDSIVSMLIIIVTIWGISLTIQNFGIKRRLNKNHEEIVEKINQIECNCENQKIKDFIESIQKANKNRNIKKGDYLGG